LFFGFFKKKREKISFDSKNLKTLEEILPFKVKMLGNKGKYILNFYIPEVDKWVSNILLVDKDEFFLSHEPEDKKIIFLAEDKNIAIEHTFTAQNLWDLVLHLSKFYENIRKLYFYALKTQLYGEIDRIFKLLRELKLRKDPKLCAEIFAKLEKIRIEDENNYRILRKQLVKECEKIVENLTSDGEIQKGYNG